MLQIVCFVGHAYQPHLPIAVCMLSAHVQKNCIGQVLAMVGKGRQRMHTGIQVSDTMQHKCMGYVLWRALIDS